MHPYLSLISLWQRYASIHYHNTVTGCHFAHLSLAATLVITVQLPLYTIALFAQLRPQRAALRTELIEVVDPQMHIFTKAMNAMLVSRMSNRQSKKFGTVTMHELVSLQKCSTSRPHGGMLIWYPLKWKKTCGKPNQGRASTTTSERILEVLLRFLTRDEQYALVQNPWMNWVVVGLVDPLTVFRL